MMPPKQTIKTYSDYLFFDTIEDLYKMKEKYPNVVISSLRDEDSEDPGYYMEEMNFVIIDNQEYEIFTDSVAANLKNRSERIKRVNMQSDCDKMKKKLLRIARCRWKAHIKNLFGGYLKSNEMILNYARNYLICYQMLKELYNTNLFESGELGLAFPIRILCLAISLAIQVSY